MIIFVRTKTSTVELADKLNARGYAASALNGDMSQNLRSQTVDQLKRGSLDILVATDVAARGLDVERISHVLNYDIPYDDEAYVHRIGRTGRAGRTGKAILFVAPRERRMLRSIERTTRKPIPEMRLPTRADLIDIRAKAFKAAIVEAMQHEELGFFSNLISEIAEEHSCNPSDIAASLAYLLQKDRPLQPPPEKPQKAERSRDRDRDRDRDNRRNDRESSRGDRRELPASQADALEDFPEIPMERFKVAVGHKDKVKPGQIVGAIANEADIDGDYIGNIKIFDTFSTVDLPAGMPKEILGILKQAKVCNRSLNMERYKEKADGGPRRSRKPSTGQNNKPQNSRPQNSKSKKRKRTKTD
ncbi:MAG: DbpA RNA binding domain-containing protein [Pseudomonadales bacterium]|nr:DbpA RNA binding domain-containing protein [Pseudomonadales bacterium]